MSHQLKILVASLSLAWLPACTSVSPTEEDFGNSVRNFVAKQQMTPSGSLEADEPIQSGDGRRLEGVTSVYQDNVGDPSPVVRQVEVQKGAQ